MGLFHPTETLSEFEALKVETMHVQARLAFIVLLTPCPSMLSAETSRPPRAASSVSRDQIPAPSNTDIRNALLYEHKYGVETVGERMGLVTTNIDTAVGSISRSSFGAEMRTFYEVAGSRCQKKSSTSFSCAFDLTMSMPALGTQTKKHLVHSFSKQNGVWRSSSYSDQVIAEANRNVKPSGNREICVQTGFGTWQGPHFENQQGLPCRP